MYSLFGTLSPYISSVTNSVNLPPLTITTPGQSSDILVRPGLLSDVGALLRPRTKSPKVALVTDSTVGPLHASKLIASLQQAGFQVLTHTLPAGEQHKHFETLLPAYTTFLAANIDRTTPLIALGGGVVGDMAGLLAGTLLRGLPFVQVPTTLMAMVDSSIGGKTGVNHPTGKNLIGVFHQPILVAMDPHLLSTLPDPELSNGLAECIKHDAIRDPAHFAQLPDILPQARAKHIDTLAALVHHNAAIKTKVVNADPFEKGERAHLNFGHTFAHAIEIATDHQIPHGAAVALGMVAAATLSNAVAGFPQADTARLKQALTLAGLPTRWSETNVSPISSDVLLPVMGRDKKVEAGKLRFVLLQTLGHPAVRADITEAQVNTALAALM